MGAQDGRVGRKLCASKDRKPNRPGCELSVDGDVGERAAGQAESNGKVNEK